MCSVFCISFGNEKEKQVGGEPYTLLLFFERVVHCMAESQTQTLPQARERRAHSELIKSEKERTW